MMNKSDKVLWTVTVFGVIALMLFFGWLFGFFDKIIPTNIVTQGNTTVNLNLINEQPQNPDCSVSIAPKDVCSGQQATGTIYAEKNVMCGVYLNYNSMGAHLLGNVLTDAEGKYSITQALTLPGTYVFSAICADCADQDTATVRVCTGEDPTNPNPDESPSDDGTRPVCSSIINPQSQTDCDAGYCNSINYGCIYHPAELAIAAHCACI
jgi:hypothetical protein